MPQSNIKSLAAQKNIFKFKQFEVDQSGCAMKINTDGVLLAVMAEATEPKNILDIGTGTGVIALMIAQRFVNANIHAVEIDKSAAETAGRNFESSIFCNRLSVSAMAVEDFNPSQRFDLVISNPPYFVNDLKNTEEKKGIARHANAAFFKNLLAKVSALLTENGVFWFVLPVKQADLMILDAADHQLSPTKIIHLHSDQSKPTFRKIVGLTKETMAPVIEHFNIYESEKVYTKAYRVLLEDFFL